MLLWGILLFAVVKYHCQSTAEFQGMNLLLSILDVLCWCQTVSFGIVQAGVPMHGASMRSLITLFVLPVATTHLQTSEFFFLHCSENSCWHGKLGNHKSLFRQLQTPSSSCQRLPACTEHLAFCFCQYDPLKHRYVVSELSCGISSDTVSRRPVAVCCQAQQDR